ncbi:hypothetical protein BKP37_12720 [Anaerobacillus alkalilacustris]|uniref:Phage head-tail adapter protein n=1 Tax=Anaerobacillus alkalilacustris TaxID=393763 RepID=A0A1S2LMR1_9BACI|nr:hypothetical protein BKP37_12720 [Anaerobacillus alkalilacustris]
MKLIGSTSYTNDKGDDIEIPTERQVLAERKSIRQSEFYQAAATDLRPELTFEVWSDEYNEEYSLNYNGKIYTIIRTFDKDEKNTELICSGLVNRTV